MKITLYQIPHTSDRMKLSHKLQKEQYRNWLVANFICVIVFLENRHKYTAYPHRLPRAGLLKWFINFVSGSALLGWRGEDLFVKFYHIPQLF